MLEKILLANFASQRMGHLRSLLGAIKGCHVLTTSGRLGNDGDHAKCSSAGHVGGPWCWKPYAAQF